MISKRTVAIAVASALLATTPSVLSGSASAAPKCTKKGTSGNNTLRGTRNRDVLCGLGGSDILIGLGGNDVLIGGGGNDTMKVGRSSDGNDRFIGGAGIDKADYGARINTLGLSVDGVQNDGFLDIPTNTPLEGDNLGLDVETLVGGSNVDHLFGNDNANTLIGGGGDDEVVDRGGNDTVRGGAGNDSLFQSATSNGADLLDGGAGLQDVVSYGLRSAPVEVLLDNLANDGAVAEEDNVKTEWAGGGTAADRLVGSANANLLSGGATSASGDDEIDGGDGDDRLFGSDGNDVVLGGNGNDEVRGGNDNDELRGGDGDDELIDIGGDPDGDLLPASNPTYVNTAHGEGGNDTFFGENQVKDLFDGGDDFDQAVEYDIDEDDTDGEDTADVFENVEDVV